MVGFEARLAILPDHRHSMIGDVGMSSRQLGGGWNPVAGVAGRPSRRHDRGVRVAERQLRRMVRRRQAGTRSTTPLGGRARNSRTLAAKDLGGQPITGAG